MYIYGLEFVLQINEQLFVSFAPRNLKRALAKSAELVVPSLPTLHGLDLAPVFKLIAALMMVGCLLGKVIVPQNALLNEAKVTLCGTCARTCCSFRGVPAAAHRFRRAQAGRSAGRGQKISSACRRGST